MAEGRFTPYTQRALLEHLFRQELYVPPSELYAGLLVLTNDGLQELGVDDYQRQRIEFGPVIDGQVRNSNEVIFGIARRDWGLIEGAALYDDLLRGNMLTWAKLDNPRPIGVSDALVFNVGDWIESII